MYAQKIYHTIQVQTNTDCINNWSHAQKFSYWILTVTESKEVAHWILGRDQMIDTKND